jgi:hypothetical protein
MFILAFKATPMIKKILLFILAISSCVYAEAQTDSTVVKKGTAIVKDSLVKKVSRPDSVVVKDTTNKAITVAKPDTAKQSVVKAPDTTATQKSPLKTLTYKQYNALIKGEDLYDMALPATLNHYPMPDDVIKYKKQLDLSPEQVAKITAIGKELHRKRVEMGPIVIKNERMLDSIFRTHIVDDGTLIFYANRYGLYQGELRNAILQACYATEKLLAPAQVKKLEAIENH